MSNPLRPGRGAKMYSPIDRRANLPAPRISAFPNAPGRLMGPGPSVGKPGATPPENVFFFGPTSGLNFSTFSEIYRGSVAGYEHGRIIVGADVTIGAASSTNVAPKLYVDVRIMGYTNGVPEVVAYGSAGSMFTGTDQAWGLADNVNMDAPPVQGEWDDSFGFDEIAVEIRTMGNGGQPFGPVSGLTSGPGDIINVNIAGKLWK